VTVLIDFAPGIQKKRSWVALASKGRCVFAESFSYNVLGSCRVNRPRQCGLPCECWAVHVGVIRDLPMLPRCLNVNASVRAGRRPLMPSGPRLPDLLERGALRLA